MCDPVKKKLQDELQSALKELEQLDSRLQQKADYGPGKGDPAIYEWELTLALRQQAQAKVEKGRYGICERCSEAINPERLEALPLTTLCIKCARSQRR